MRPLFIDPGVVHIHNPGTDAFRVYIISVFTNPLGIIAGL
jgi:hypothetical protein